MDKNRLETFSDGVMAIIITIMALGLSVAHNPSFESYLQAWPKFASYAISFVFVGLYWYSHHHLFHTAKKVNNKVLWLNMLSLFWLSLIPFATSSMGENSFTSSTVTVYAIVLIPVTVTYIFLVNQLCRLHDAGSEFSNAYKGHLKSYVTIGLNIVAAFISLIGFPKIAFIMIALTALMWFIPNLRLDINHKKGEERLQ